MLRFLILIYSSLAAQAQSSSPAPPAVAAEGSGGAPALLGAQFDLHAQRGWSLPAPGPGPRLDGGTARDSLAPSLLSAQAIKRHTENGWSLPLPGAARAARAAPRYPPAHAAHGPRAPLPYDVGVRHAPVKTPRVR